MAAEAMVPTRPIPHPPIRFKPIHWTLTLVLGYHVPGHVDILLVSEADAHEPGPREDIQFQFKPSENVVCRMGVHAEQSAHAND